MIAIFNLALAIVLLVLTLLWFREGHIAKLSLASQYSRLIMVVFGVLGTVTVADRAAEATLGYIPAYHDILPTVAWALRTVAAIVLLALVVTTARTRRTGRWRNNPIFNEGWNRPK